MSDEPYKVPAHAIPYLELIRLGVPTWNKWIKGALTEEEAADVAAKLAPTPVPISPLCKPGIRQKVNFSLVDFTQPDNQDIFFEGATLGDYADFHKSIFGEKTNFQDVIIGDWANFNETTFGNNANFERATFGSNRLLKNPP